MELLTYKSYPKPIRLVITNIWIREIMFRLTVINVADLLKELKKVEGREVEAAKEEKSNFWYLAIKTCPVTWLHKVNSIEAYFPNTKSILEHPFWHFIFTLRRRHLRSKPAHFYNHYCGPAIQHSTLLTLIDRYINRSIRSKFSEAELEHIHSLDGLSAFLSMHYINMYEKRPTNDCLKNLFEAFLKTFSVRYRSQFVWVIFNFLRAHIKEYGSPPLPQFISEIDSEEELLHILNKINKHVEKANSANLTLRQQLLFLAKDETAITSI
ncbi:hypothetical protein [Pseudoalteromonas sp. JSTW]|uniref:hypothetical protein n=1 Tax=Pseudoalteromonas sp. JSTW TaxID=2752475 RepID=UPI0015D566CB|nr:hypothetical protein [Pseudoalteromonas sp. JSTW]QLJ07241.1 hypothetical protein GZH31_10575 [Pseudoalteromonas sp. JSTW]